MSLVEQAEREYNRVSKILVDELGLLPNFADDYFMRVWNALVRDRCSLLALRKAAELSADSVHNGLKKCDCGACGRVKFVLQRGALEGER